MARRSLKLAFVAVLLSPGIVLAQDEIGPNITPVEDGSGRMGRTTFVMVDPINDLAPDAVRSDHVAKLLFVNRCVGGCTISPGNNDARANTSSIVGGQVGVVTEFNGGDQVWEDAMECIRDVYAPYDIEVVDVDPGNEIFHHEAILAGNPGDVGLSNSIGGIAPSGCAPLNNVISFSFANANFHQNDPIRMCATVAQESAHSFGLPNHVFNCLDPMTYLEGCGKKLFRNQDYPCGEFSPRACTCGGATQNSHRELLSVFGPGDTVIPPPVVDVILPEPDDEVSGSFPIFWTATDARLIGHNEIWVNGSMVAEIPGNDFGNNNQAPDYNIQAPSLPDGYLDIEIKSYNDIGTETIASLTVLKGQPCQNADTCFEFQSCNDGRCSYPSSTKELGESCDVTEECLEGVCTAFGGDKACSVTCNPNVTGGCAEGFDCVGDDTGGFVCRTQSETGGCCSVAGTKRDPLPWFGASLFLLGLMILRRKRHAS